MAASTLYFIAFLLELGLTSDEVLRIACQRWGEFD